MADPKKRRADTADRGRMKLASIRKRLDIMDIEIGVYREVGGLVSRGKTLPYILRRLMDFALKAVDTDSGTLYLLDRAKERLTFEVVKGPRARRFKGMSIPSGSGIAGRVASTGRPYISEDVESDKAWLDIEDTGAHKNMMAVPLKIKGKVFGVVEVINKGGGRRFTKEDLKVLGSLANHFSIVMERARLFSERDDRLKQFSTLHDVGALLNSTLDQAVVRRLAMQAITRLMHAETGSLLLVDEEAGALYFEVALGAKGRRLSKVRLNLGEGFAGWVAEHGRPLIVHDVTRDKRWQGQIDKQSKFKTRDMICVPVKTKGKVIGVLQAINRVEGAFSRDDLRLFQLFSNQVAIALDNARLYEEIRETFYATSGALAEAIEKRDPYTGGHTKRVLEYSLAIARRLRMPRRSVEVLKLSALLHDIGKIGIEDRILRKEAPLTAEEAALMKGHPQLGAEILEHVPQLKDMVPGMLHHHERADGGGYPKGFKLGQIPLMARIISVADTYDAMTTTRPYRKGLPTEVALDELRKNSGTQFDGRVVKAFINAFEREEIGALSAGAGDAGAGPGKGQ
jgi:putative nucleotidyltransferase with HDIG domain